MSLKCRQCKEETVLTFPFPTKSTDYDKEGVIIWYCSTCGYCENRNTIEDRNIRQAFLMERSIWSNRLRKETIFELAKNNGFDSEEQRKIFIAETINNARNVSDNYCVKVISEAFGIKPIKVLDTMFRLYRATKSDFKSYEVSNKIR